MRTIVVLTALCLVGTLVLTAPLATAVKIPPPYRIYRPVPGCDGSDLAYVEWAPDVNQPSSLIPTVWIDVSSCIP